MYPHELCGQEEARDAISELLSDSDTNTNYYVVEERDEQPTSWPTPKSMYRAVRESMAATMTEEGEPRIVEASD